MKKIIGIFITFVSILFQSCFTGIESTPKITLSDKFKTNSLEKSAEEIFLADIKNQGFSKWSKNKEFYVTDNKISLIFTSSNATTSLMGTTIKYQGYNIVPSVTNECATELKFLSESSDTLKYRINATPQELISRDYIEIPFTIQTSLINEVKNRLINNSYYIITSSWYNSYHCLISGRKYIPISITNIEAGNHIFPIIVTFQDPSKNSYCVFMTVGNEMQSTRNFNTLFSFTDPRQKYPNITDENWIKITNSTISKGMTKKECQLSLGMPSHVDQQPSNAGVIEIWIYDNGYNILFEDGIVKDFKR